MVKIEFLGEKDIEQFYERRAREGGIYYRDETDYKFGSDEPIIPKYTKIDLTPAIIRMAQNTFINFGHVLL